MVTLARVTLLQNPKRVRTEPPKSKAIPPIPPSQNVDRDVLIAAINNGVLSQHIADAVR